MCHSLTHASVTPPVPTTGGVAPGSLAVMDQFTPLLPQALVPMKGPDTGPPLRWNAAHALVVLGLALTVLWLGVVAFGLVLLVWNAV